LGRSATEKHKKTGVSILFLTFTTHVRNRPVSTDKLRNTKPNTYNHTLGMTNTQTLQRVCQSEINRRKVYIGSFNTSLQCCMYKVYHLLNTNSFQNKFCVGNNNLMRN